MIPILIKFLSISNLNLPNLFTKGQYFIYKDLPFSTYVFIVLKITNSEFTFLIREKYIMKIQITMLITFS